MAGALLVSSSFLPGRGGIESHLAELCASLAPHVAVLAPQTRDGRRIPEGLGYPVVGYAGSMLAPTPALQRAVESGARAHGTDRILFGTPWPLALLGPSLRASGFRYAVVAHGAETILPGTIPLLGARLARALAQADLLLPVSDFTRHEILSLLRRADQAPPRMELLRPRIDVGRFSPSARSDVVRRRLAVARDTPLVLCFGRLVARKGVHRLVAAYRDLAERVPDVTVVVAGTGPQERRLRRLTARTGARVVFTGPVAEEDAPGVYASADVFALPVADRWGGLDVEGLGVALLEAAACEVACVTGRSGGTPEAVVNGRTGYVVDARDHNALTRALRELLEHPDTARRMGAAGRRHVESHFSGMPPRALLDWVGR